MFRNSPKIWMITLFDSENPKHRQVFSMIWYSLVVVLFCLAISVVLMHSPIDTYKLFIYTAFFGIILFVSMLVSTGLWSKPIFQRSPLMLILYVFLWCIIRYPVLTHSPIYYVELFGDLVIFAYFFFSQIKILTRERTKPI